MRYKEKNHPVFVDATLCFMMLFLLHPFYIKQLYTVITAIYVLLPICYGFYVLYKNKFKLRKKIITFIILYVFHAITALVCFIINGSNDTTYFLELVENFIKILSFSMLTVWSIKLFQKRRCSLVYPQIFICGVCIYVISTIFFLVFPRFKDPWIQIIGVNNVIKGYSWVPEYATRFSIAGWSSFHGAYFAGFSILYLLWSYSQKIIKGKKLFLTFILCSLGCAFYGRFGILMEIVIIILYIVLSLGSRIKKKSVIGILFFLVLLCIAICILSKNEVASQIIHWMTEPFRYFIGGDKSSSASLNELADMYNSISFDMKGLLIGSGKWLNEDGSYYGHIDIGFFRNLYYGGILYTILLYTAMFYFIYSLSKELAGKSRKTYLWMILLIVYFVLGEAKGDTVFYFIKLSFPLYLYAKNLKEENRCMT